MTKAFFQAIIQLNGGVGGLGDFLCVGGRWIITQSMLLLYFVVVYGVFCLNVQHTHISERCRKTFYQLIVLALGASVCALYVLYIKCITFHAHCQNKKNCPPSASSNKSIAHTLFTFSLVYCGAMMVWDAAKSSMGVLFSMYGRSMKYLFSGSHLFFYTLAVC